jgi:Microcystin-dependent protein
MCDGAEYDRTSLVYQRLYNVIGFKYGTGSTGNMFRVPDLQGRMAVGKGTHASVDTLGKSEGVATGSRSPLHAHRLPGDSSGNASAAGDGYIMLTDYGPTNRTIAEPGKPVDAPAFLVVNKIISLGS